MNRVGRRLDEPGIIGTAKSLWSQPLSALLVFLRRRAYGARVPTVLREKGYRIGFYSSEPDEPAHVHVRKAGCEAKFWLAPVQLSWNKGFRESDLLEIVHILEDHETQLLEAWNEIE